MGGGNSLSRQDGDRTADGDATGRRSLNYLVVFIKKLAVIRSKENNKLDKFQTSDVFKDWKL